MLNPNKDNSFIAYNLISLPCYNNPTRNLTSRCIAFLIKDNISYSIIKKDINPCEFISAKIKVNNISCIVATIYYSPSITLPVDCIVNLTRTGNHIILGDFNARHTDYGDSLNNKNGLLLAKLCIKTNLKALANTHPTYINYLRNGSILDHIRITPRLFNTFKQLQVTTDLESDHLPIYYINPSNDSDNQGPYTQQYIFNPKEANWNIFQVTCNNSLDISLNDLYSSHLIDSAIEITTACVHNAMTESIPKKKRNKNNTHLNLPTHIIKLIQTKRTLRKNYQRIQDISLLTQITIITRKINLAIKDFRKNSLNTMCNSLHSITDSHLFWNKFNKLATPTKKKRNYSTLL